MDFVNLLPVPMSFLTPRKTPETKDGFPRRRKGSPGPLHMLGRGIYSAWGGQVLATKQEVTEGDLGLNMKTFQSSLFSGGTVCCPDR